MGGMVLETNMTEILTRIEEQNKLEKSEVKAIPNDLYFTVMTTSYFSEFIYKIIISPILKL